MIYQLILVCVAMAYSGLSVAQSSLGPLKQVAVPQQPMFDVRMVAFYICIVISLLVIAALFYALLRFRRTRGNKAKHFHQKLSVELLWTAIPLIILISLMIPAIIVLVKYHKEQEKPINMQTQQLSNPAGHHARQTEAD